MRHVSRSLRVRRPPEKVIAARMNSIRHNLRHGGHAVPPNGMLREVAKSQLKKEEVERVHTERSVRNHLGKDNAPSSFNRPFAKLL